jgi:4'-phosphopantetheinyl transferase
VHAAPLHVAWGDAALLEAQAQRARFEGALSGEEHARLAAIASPTRRRQFIAARWLLRTLLADVHGGAPPNWRLSGGIDGPPRVLGADGAIHLAVTHSAHLVACAVAAVPLGLDIEAPQRERDVLALAELACDETEQAMLRAQPPAQRDALFYELWTAKEAWLKRHSGSMAPRRMARIHLRPAASFDDAPIRVWSLAAATLALAATAQAPVHWHGPALAARSGWDVSDEA